MARLRARGVSPAPNVRDIWGRGVTEMVNDALDHSGFDVVRVLLRRERLRDSVRLRGMRVRRLGGGRRVGRSISGHSTAGSLRIRHSKAMAGSG